MKMIVGLGNPGARYRNTRHNVGFEIVDRLAARLAAAFDREKHRGLMAKAVHGGETVVLLKPLTFMNESGLCVASAMRNSSASPEEDLLVIVDDIHLPVGRIRIRAQGSAGGHNGLKSIIERLGTDAFPRMRIGVGEQGAAADLTSHVLGRFRPEEREVLAEVMPRAEAAAMCFLTEGLGRAMTDYNGPMP